MGKSRKEIAKQFPKIREMYNSGSSVTKIAEFFGVSRDSIYNAFTINGLSLKKSLIDENNMVYADNSIVLEKIVINGKNYTDMTPIFSPR